ncbi:MAG: hypothetical protein R3314_01015 [Longimicrobiales bacterium]|nr:hypothetical protein [Longimicrobiales bacterium]
MIRQSLSLLAVTLALTACALNMGRPRPIDLSAVAVRVVPDLEPDALAEALLSADPDVALVTGAVDSAWLDTVAEFTGLTVSGPANVGDGAMAFLGGEPVGDTTIVLTYDGGALTLHDALYRVAEERFLDLLIFRVADAATVRPAIRALVRYMATDVMNSAAVVMAVEVPSSAAGDSVARMLSPAYYDAVRCEPGVAAPAVRAGIRLFYGPDARVYCRSATTETRSVGDWIGADLVLGRR